MMNRIRGNRKGCRNRQNRLSLLIKGIIFFIILLITVSFLLENSSIYYRNYKIMKPRNYFFRLSSRDLYLIKGEMYHLKLYTINKRVTFSTTDFRVASVGFHGRIFAHQPGKAFILAKVGKKELKCRVHVLDINKRSITLKPGRSKHLYIKGSNAFVRWKSANPRVANVSLFGRVKAKKKGKTIIYAKVKGRTLTCVVRVQ